MMGPEEPVIVSTPMVSNGDTEAFVILKKVLKTLREWLVRKVVKFLLVRHGGILERSAYVGYACDNGNLRFCYDPGEL